MPAGLKGRPVEATQVLPLLADKAARLRIHSIESTTAAGSGHPTSCASAAEIMSALFYSVMRPNESGEGYRDHFILSKGHAAPILYAAWAECGAIPKESLLTLRSFDSDLEGHPTPRLSFVDVATGSLGQGINAGVGMALNSKFVTHSGERTYVLLGDGEMAEGSVWEAAEVASYYGLNSLCVTIDINRLGQSGPTMLEHDLQRYDARWRSFGWQVFPVDGHNLSELLTAYEAAGKTVDRPSVVLARTHKGKGIPGIEDKNGHHGKPLTREEMDKAVKELRKQCQEPPPAWGPLKLPERLQEHHYIATSLPAPPYSTGSKPVATRKAFGDALAALAPIISDVVVLDGDVKNSTYTEAFQEVAPDRFFEMFISEQNMVGAAMGLAARGRIPFAATFACFLTRAYDFIRMAAISGSNIKLVGTHAGISIGEDGPSQMGLEDLAMFLAEPNFTVLYPSDAVSTWHATAMLAGIQGPAYMRVGRPANEVLYSRDEKFALGQCKILRSSPDDQVTIVAAGVTVFEALKAYDELAKRGTPVRVVDLFSLRPLDRNALLEAVKTTQGRLVVVEDHYSHGGLGNLVCSTLTEEGESLMFRSLAVRQIARSGPPERLMEAFGISASHIVGAVQSLL